VECLFGELAVVFVVHELLARAEEAPAVAAVDDARAARAQALVVQQ